jgi:3-oxoacyl-[acyl-carrier protein] reductase
MTVQHAGMRERIAVVTGASRGIGRAIAWQLAESGAKVVVNYIRRHDAAQTLVEEIRSAGGEAIALRADATQPPQVEEMLDHAIAAWGQLNVFVACAVQPMPKTILQMSLDEWDTCMRANARSFFIGAQASARRMEEGSGRIIGVSATGVHRVRNPQYAPLAMAKGAVEAAVRYFAAALAPRGITVNALAPGPTDTEAFDTMAGGERDTLVARLAKLTPLGRLGKPEDAAALAAFLCSDGGAWVTGQTIFVDGGYTL